MLDPSLWISGVLNEVFVFGLPGLVDLPVAPQSSSSLQYTRALVCRSRACGRCFMFPESFSVKCPVLPLCYLSSKTPSSLSSVNRIFLTGISSCHCLVFIAKRHATLPAYRHCIKNNYFTMISSAFAKQTNY